MKPDLKAERIILGKSLGLTFVARGLTIGGVLILTIIVNNAIGLAEAGEFFLAYILANFAAIAGRFGLDFHIVREIASHDDRKIQSKKFAEIILNSLCLTFGLFVLSFIIWLGSGFETRPIFMVWLVLIPITLSNIIAGHLRAQKQPVIGAILEAGIFSTLACPALAIAYSAGIVTTAQEVWFLFAAVVWIAFIGMHGAVLFTQFRLIDEWPELGFLPIIQAWLLGFSNILAFVSQWGAVMVVGLFMSVEFVAIMNGIFRLAAPLQFLFVTLDGFLAPRFANDVAKENLTAVKQDRWAGILIGLAGGVAYAAVLLGLPKYTSGLVLGDSYLQYQTEILVLMVFFLAYLGLGSNGHILIARSQDKTLLKGTVLRSALSLVLLFLLIPDYGVMGGCLAFAISMLVNGGYLRYCADFKLKQ